jgi:uncharacterized coiled-coil DUF342 family protein
METMTETGTEKRVDELSKRVDRGFERVDRGFEQVDRGFEQVDKRFEQVEGEIRDVRSEVHELRIDTKRGFERMESKFDAKFDSLNRTIIYLLGGSLSVLTAGVIAAAFRALF